ncbi:hypothetical protein [Antribacter gilvus]|uniref:hypothetical protein n=1 Tax=Antribacter gilvus TaxID=2304675 RepID=UPI000F7AA3D8|nr:hypothetical protein [Antribacter gilvus]
MPPTERRRAESPIMYPLSTSTIDLAADWARQTAVELRDCWTGWPEHVHGRLLQLGADRALAPMFADLPDLTGGPCGSELLRFDNLDAPAAAALLDVLEEDDLADRQNDGPTLGNVLRAVAAHPGQLVAHGYVVGPARCDERVTVEGVIVGVPDALEITRRHDDGCACDQLIEHLATLGVDDALGRPDEITPWHGHLPGTVHGPEAHDGPEPVEWWRLWWD